ncbi:MAG: hypothetical protein JRI41_08425 [Deltaproteobacteria bacterium]|nr:hypothetical protein [Deltaproteobacteria bacterium]
MISWFSSSLIKKLVINGIAFTAYHFSRKKRRLIEKNLFKAFDGKLNKNQRGEIVKGAFHEYWQDTFWLLPSKVEKAALSRVEIRGLEYLHKALEDGKGVILWESAVFGQRNLAKQILHEKGFSLYQIHNEKHLGTFFIGKTVTWMRIHVIKRFFERCEKQFVEDIIYLPSTDSLLFTRILLNRLKQNAILCVTGDAEFGEKLIPIKFFHCIKFLPTGMVSLAKISGASILPLFCIQGENGEINLIIEQPIQIKTGVDKELGLEKSINQYVGLLESYIRRYPEKYQAWQCLCRSERAEFNAEVLLTNR